VVLLIGSRLRLRCTRCFALRGFTFFCHGSALLALLVWFACIVRRVQFSFTGSLRCVLRVHGSDDSERRLTRLRAAHAHTVQFCVAASSVSVLRISVAGWFTGCARSTSSFTVMVWIFAQVAVPVQDTAQ